VRYIIIGAGAVGGTIGGCLAQGGHEVARGAHLQALRAAARRLPPGSMSPAQVLAEAADPGDYL
jgi:ketopantoate reductase